MQPANDFDMSYGHHGRH